MYRSRARVKKFAFCVYCAPAEKRYIEIRAREAGMPISTFLRTIALTGFPEKVKTLPPEVLAFNGQLSQIIGTLEIIARKRLDNEDLDSLERAELIFQGKGIKLLIQNIKSYLK